MKLINLNSNSTEADKLNSFIFDLQKDKIQYEFQSSGSTGEPKKFFFSKKQIEISAKQTIDFFKLTKNDFLLCPFSMDFVAAKMMVARAYFLNANLVFTGPVSDPISISKLPAISFAALVPLQLKVVLNNSTSLTELNKIRNVIIGGAPISNQLFNTVIEKVKTDIFQTYGMTETLSHIAVKKLDQNKTHYRLLQGVKIDVDNRGCLRIKSPINETWLQSNDLVKLTYDGFEWLGRYDLVINSGGFKIRVNDLEEKISIYLSYIQFFICGIESDKYDEECVVVAQCTMPAKFGNIFKADEFHAFEKPKKWVRLSEFPISNNGKIMRARLKELVTLAVANGNFQDVV